MKNLFNAVALPCLVAACVVIGATSAFGSETVVTAESFAQAVSDAVPGQTLELADGVYRDVKLKFNTKGEADKPIVLRAQHPGKAIFVGSSDLTVSGEHLVVSGLAFDQAWGKRVVDLSSAKNCRLTDCTFVACGDPNSTFSHVVHLLNGSTSNRVDHCYFEGSLSMSLAVRVHADDHASSHNWFDHNFFRNIERRSYNGQEAVQIGQSTFSSRQPMHTLVEHCLFDNASADAEIISNKSSCNTYRFNTFSNCRSSLTLRMGSGVLVHGNVFVGCSGGVRAYAANSVVAGNRIENCGDGLLLDKGDGAELDVDGHMATHHCIFANNVIRNCKQSAIRIGRGSPGSAGTAVMPFANVFANNAISGNTGVLLQFDGANNQIWRDTFVSAEGAAKPGAQPEGVKVEKVLELQPANVAKFKADIDPILAGMICPRTFEEAFPLNLEVRALEPREVGPVWMHGDPQQAPRIGERKTPPDLSKRKPTKKSSPAK